MVFSLCIPVRDTTAIARRIARLIAVPTARHIAARTAKHIAVPIAGRTDGPSAGRIAAISPMSDEYSQNVASFYEAAGFDVPYHCGLHVGRSQDIINIGYSEAREAFIRLDRDDVDMFLHVGGALGIADCLESLETELGRPVVSVNYATY